MSLVKYEEINQHLGLITLNDPDNLNAMGDDMAVEFAECVAKIKYSSHKLRSLILTGAGRAFSAGGHLDMLEKKTTLSGEENRLRMLKFYDSFLGILNLNVPLIAAINGHAIGAGLCIACACDVRVAADGAKLGMTFTRLGLHPGMGATYFLPRILGTAKARELMLTGRVVTALEAHELGLVSQVVSTEGIMPAATKIAQEIADCGPESVRQLLQSLRSEPVDLKASLEREALCQGINYASPEFKEGVRAAIEKRKAEF